MYNLYRKYIDPSICRVQYVGRAIDKDCIIDRVLNSVSILATYFINYHFYIVIRYPYRYKLFHQLINDFFRELIIYLDQSINL